MAIASGLGAWCVRIDQPCDYLVWWRDRWHLVEIKRPDKAGRRSEYTPAQLRFRATASARAAEVLTWRTEADVLHTLGAERGA